MNLYDLTVTLGIDASGLNRGVVALNTFRNQATSSMASVSASMERTANQFQRFGYAATTYLTLPIAAVGLAAVKMANDLEFATQKIVALSGVTQTQVNAMSGFITRTSNSTGRTSKEIAESLYYVTSAGISAAKAMDIVSASARAAATGMGTTDDISRLLIYATKAYGDQAYSASRMVDILTAAVREGTAEAHTMANVMGMVLPVAAQLGVRFDQVASAQCTDDIGFSNDSRTSRAQHV